MPTRATAKSKSRSRVVSTSTARAKLGQILRRVKSNKERILIEQRGEPQAILMSLEDFVDTIAPAPGWLQEAWESARSAGLDKMTMREIDAEIATARLQQANPRFI